MSLRQLFTSKESSNSKCIIKDTCFDSHVSKYSELPSNIRTMVLNSVNILDLEMFSIKLIIFFLKHLVDCDLEGYCGEKDI